VKLVDIGTMVLEEQPQEVVGSCLKENGEEVSTGLVGYLFVPL
jgi:hypothetical protein